MLNLADLTLIASGPLAAVSAGAGTLVEPANWLVMTIAIVVGGGAGVAWGMVGNSLAYRLLKFETMPAFFAYLLLPIAVWGSAAFVAYEIGAILALSSAA